jgi:hypothetical protein
MAADARRLAGIRCTRTMRPSTDLSGYRICYQIMSAVRSNKTCRALRKLVTARSSWLQVRQVSAQCRPGGGEIIPGGQGIGVVRA